jgi:hypothetical protein
MTSQLDYSSNGETPHTSDFASCEIEQAPEPISPTQLAQFVLDHRGESVREELLGTVSLCQAVTSLQGDGGRLEQFFQALKAGRYLTSDEANQGLAGSKLSKIRKIEEFGHVLFEDTICTLLSPSIELFYEAALFAEACQGQADDLTIEVHTRLDECDGPITRKWLQTKRKAILNISGRAAAKSSVSKLTSPVDTISAPASDQASNSGARSLRVNSAEDNASHVTNWPAPGLVDT